MDATITYDEVAALIGVNIPTLEPRPNFERIRALRPPTPPMPPKHPTQMEGNGDGP